MHNYRNYQNSFWGIEVGAYDESTSVYGKNLRLDTCFMLWAQPEGQEFTTTKRTLGGLAQVKVYYPWSSVFSTYLDLEAKTQGWVAGNPFIKENVSVRAGIALKFAQHGR